MAACQCLSAAVALVSTCLILGLACSSQPPGADQFLLAWVQDIGRTLAQLNITVDSAVNAGLLGGLSASDVRIVGDAHSQEVERMKAASAAPASQGAAGLLSLLV